MGPVYRGERRLCLRAVRALPARSDSAWTRRRARCSPTGRRNSNGSRGRADEVRPADTTAAIAAFNLAESIRRFGHLAARLDPLGVSPIRLATRRSIRKPHGLTSDTLARLPASIVGGPAAEGAANALEAIERLRAIYCADDRSRLQPRLRAGRARVAAPRGRDRPVPAAARSDQRAGAARSHHAGRDLRALPAPHVPGQDALFDRRPRHDDPDPRRDHPRRGRRRRPARDDRDGPSRPAQRARAHPAEAVCAGAGRVQGSALRAVGPHRPRLDGRREVSRRSALPGRRRWPAAVADHQHAAESQPPRSGRSGAGRHGARGGDVRDRAGRPSCTRSRCWGS